MKTKKAEQSKLASKLAECEAKIKGVYGKFHVIGEELLEIQNHHLYTATHSTFTEYCRMCLDMTIRHAQQLIESAQIFNNTRTMVRVLSNERQARELAGLTPDNQRKVWKEVVETAPNGVITAAYIRKTREALINDPEQETLFTLEDYRQAIADHVAAANHHRATSNYHVRQATHLRDEAFEKFAVQIELPFEFADRNSD